MISIVSVMSVAIPIVMLILIVLILTIGYSPKLRAKLLGRQIKTMKYVVDENKETLEDIGTTTGNIGVNVKKNIIDQNEEQLKDMATKQANISKDAVEITARAVKDGFTNDTIYCKYCGAKIDMDSKFCKECGKEQ